MKVLKLLFLYLFVGICIESHGQVKTSFPSTSLRGLNNQQIELNEMVGQDSVTVLSFWASWCKPCVNELSAIADNYEDWKDKVDFTFLAVSVDDSRSTMKVRTMVNGQNWPFEVALDNNKQLFRYFGANNIPFTVVLKHGEVAHTHRGYLPGDEDVLWKIIQNNEYTIDR